MSDQAPKIAINTYTVRQDAARDLPGTMAALAKMGYTAVEAASLPNTVPAREIRRILAARKWLAGPCRTA